MGTDPFYLPPSNSTDLPAGSLLRAEDVDTRLYTLPPNTALSRILYITENLNGTKIPASAYVLWPYLPQLDGQDKYRLVAWADSASGFLAECAPSHVRNLWNQYAGPYTLALSGYVVVAPDYAGLGVSQTYNGTAIPNQSLATPAQANDLIYAVEAAQHAYNELSSSFVVVGLSEGGGAAWATAQRQAQKPTSGYLGAIAA